MFFVSNAPSFQATFSIPPTGNNFINNSVYNRGKANNHVDNISIRNQYPDPAMLLLTTC